MRTNWKGNWTDKLDKLETGKDIPDSMEDFLSRLLIGGCGAQNSSLQLNLEGIRDPS